MKWYLLINKPDDYGNCSKNLYFGRKETVEDYVYVCKEVPEEHISILKIYIDVLNNYYKNDEELLDYLDSIY